MTQLDRNDITNLYFYGQLSTPANLVDANLIRPKDAVSDVPVDVKRFKAGRVLRISVPIDKSKVTIWMFPSL